MDFRLGRDNAAAESIQLAAIPMVTLTMKGQHTTIKANLAIIGRLTPILWTTNSEPKRKVVTYVFA